MASGWNDHKIEMILFSLFQYANQHFQNGFPFLTPPVFSHIVSFTVNRLIQPVDRRFINSASVRDTGWLLVSFMLE